MPSATNTNTTVKSASPEVRSAPTKMGSFPQGTQSDVLKQVLGVIDKKVRNMEKKKSKLDDYQIRKSKGEGLNHDQLEALSKYQEVANNLEFARELQKTFDGLRQEIQKVAKKSARREQIQREMAEQKRLKTVLELQFILDRLGDSTVRQNLKKEFDGTHLLTDEDLAAFDEFYKLVGPERDHNLRLTDQYDEASLHLRDLLEGKNKPVIGTTYAALKETLDRVLLSGYFDQIPIHQNGVCEEEEGAIEEEATAIPAAVTAAESPEAEERTPEAETEVIEEFTEPIAVETTEFVNRQFILESTYSGSEKEQGEQWTRETETIATMHQQPVQPVVSPAPLDTRPVTLSPPVPPNDPMVRKQVVQDLMAQMQGPYNFMQDSMLEYDGPPIDPAIVSAQPMKPQSMEPPQMVCPPESRLPQSNPTPAQNEPTQVPIVSSSPSPLYQNAHAQDPRPPSESINSIQTSMSLSAEQPPPSTALPPAAQTQVFQPVSKPPHTSGINVNAAPFQSMQTVFNLNAPIPPANETEALNQASQYQNSYSQAFGSQSQHPAEQAEMPSEQLQSVGAFHSQDQSGGHQQPAQQNSGFGRQGQSFYNSRGMPRGGPRNPRGMMNGYRGSSNGFRGGYDGYRAPFANTPNSGYGQAQFNTSRDYSSGNYQRDGYQQNYKRGGAGQGPRGMSRGSTQAMRS